MRVNMQGLDIVYQSFLQITEPIELKIIADIATPITAIVLFITVLIFRGQSKNQELQLAASNYSIIFDRFDDPIAKAARRIIYRSHARICKLESNYQEKNKDVVLDSVNEVAKYIASVYDSIYVLVKDNKPLEAKLIEHHGFTMGRLWKVLQGLHQTWINNDSVGAYVGFKTLGVKSCKDKERNERIEKWFTEYHKTEKDPISTVDITLLKQKILGQN